MPSVYACIIQCHGTMMLVNLNLYLLAYGHTLLVCSMILYNFLHYKHIITIGRVENKCTLHAKRREFKSHHWALFYINFCRKKGNIVILSTYQTPTMYLIYSKYRYIKVPLNLKGFKLVHILKWFMLIYL